MEMEEVMTRAVRLEKMIDIDMNEMNSRQKIYFLCILAMVVECRRP